MSGGLCAGSGSPALLWVMTVVTPPVWPELGAGPCPQQTGGALSQRCRPWGMAGCPLLHQLRDQGGIIWLVPQGNPALPRAAPPVSWVFVLCDQVLSQQRDEVGTAGGSSQDKAHPQKSSISFSFCLK